MKHLIRVLIRTFSPALLVIAPAVCSSAPAAATGVQFPGPQPGRAVASTRGQLLTLENNVIEASWRWDHGRLSPVALRNKLTGTTMDQSGTELFRLATRPAPTPSDTVFVGIRLDSDKVAAMASRDGVSWTQIATFPRKDFAGEPGLVRVGKMNLTAQAQDYPDHGSMGEGKITDITPRPDSLPLGQFAFKTGANQAAVAQFPYPAGRKFISCRIDKGTDQGMSWSPALAVIWQDGRKFLLVGLRDKRPTFNITTFSSDPLQGETIRQVSLAVYPAFDLPSSGFHLSAPPHIVRYPGDAHAAGAVDRSPSVCIEANLVNSGGVRAVWRAELRDNSNYVRKKLELASPAKIIPICGVELTDVRIAGAKTIGMAPGCPVAGDGVFLGVEIPGAENAVGESGVRIGFGCKLELSPAQSYTFGSVMGVAPAGQLRRSFLYYIERERARPSKPFLHYNCWYDLGYGLDQDKLLDVVKSFTEELVKKRGVPVMSYLADDGWDDPDKGLWVENTARFPHGFAGLSEAMKAYGAHLGVWISPLGGYGGANERTGWARKMGLIPAGSALDLAQPAYKKWFADRCLQLMREDGVNAFKWDRAGNGVTPHVMALLDIAHTLRKQNPDVFINVTVGTWPSPFWLNHIDSTWRDGSADVGWAGKGDDREKWLTFRDGNCRVHFVEMSPLYPLNSVMHHGIVEGRNFQGEKVGKSGPNLKNEARSYFANGTSLQELYITPSMMTPAAWDYVAEAAKWAHANADVLEDAHWVGGDPLKLEPYGYAAWNPRKGTLMLRNPDDKPRTIALDSGVVFDLPAGAPRAYALRSPYKDQRMQSLALSAGRLQKVTLEPFEVLVFDAYANR